MNPVASAALAAGMAALLLSPVAVGVPVFGPAEAFAKENGGGNGGGARSAEKSGGKSASRSAAVGPSDVAAGDETAGPKNRGTIASELKGLNAYRASEQAFANAAPNSQVGRIAAYRNAAVTAAETGERLAAAQQALDAATQAVEDLNRQISDLDAAYGGRTAAEIQADIDALDPAAADYADRLAGLTGELAGAEAYDGDRAALEAALADAEAVAGETQSVYDTAAADAATAAEAEDAALMTASNGRALSSDALDYLRAQLGL